MKPDEMMMSTAPEFEKMVLASILLSRQMFPDLLPEFFTGGRARLFRAIEEQFLRGEIDPMILRHDFPEEVFDVLEASPNSSERVIEELVKHYKIRATGEMILRAESLETVEEVLDHFGEHTGKIALKKTDHQYDHQRAVGILHDQIARGQIGKRETSGYSTGLLDLDSALNGIEPGKMYVIGALKKTGKSRFAIFLTIKLIEQGASVLWNSLEMNAIQLNTCALSYYSGVDGALFGRVIPQDDYRRVTGGALNMVSNLDWVVCREKTIRDLKSRILSERVKRKIDVVVVDFIQRMEYPDLRRDRVREVEYIAKNLADMSREMNVAIIALCQLAGYAERLADDEMPNMSHIKESQGVPENADAIITLHNFKRHESPVNEDGSYILPELDVLIEQRYAISGGRFKLLADMRTCKFNNMTRY